LGGRESREGIDTTGVRGEGWVKRGRRWVRGEAPREILNIGTVEKPQ